jgi:hypothetical protein
MHEKVTVADDVYISNDGRFKLTVILNDKIQDIILIKLEIITEHII